MRLHDARMVILDSVYVFVCVWTSYADRVKWSYTRTISHHIQTSVTEYHYASCTHIPTGRGGSLMGSFKFVPGSIEEPRGPPFDVSIPRIELVVPDFF